MKKVLLFLCFVSICSAVSASNMPLFDSHYFGIMKLPEVQKTPQSNIPAISQSINWLDTKNQNGKSLVISAVAYSLPQVDLFDNTCTATTTCANGTSASYTAATCDQANAVIIKWLKDGGCGAAVSSPTPDRCD